MKKFLIVVCALFVTGCGNEFVCTRNIEEEVYKTEEKIVFEFDKDNKITDTTVDYIMTFETEEQAKAYSKVLESLSEGFDVNLDGKILTISGTKNYEQYKNDKDKLKESLEKDGYTCK